MQFFGKETLPFLSKLLIFCDCQVLDWNTPSIEYYKRQGAVDLSTKEGWLCFRMNKDVMERFVQK